MKNTTPQGEGSRAGAIVYIAIAAVSIWFLYWFGNIGSAGHYGVH